MKKPHTKTLNLLYELFDTAQAGAAPHFLYECTPTYALYLRRQAQGLADRYMRESVLMFEPSDPLYGIGIYYNLRFTIVPAGLLISRVDKPATNPQHLLIRAAFLGPLEIECESTSKAVELTRKLSSIRAKMAISDNLPEILEGIRLLEVTSIDEKVYIRTVMKGLTVRSISQEELNSLLEDIDTPEK